MRLDRDRRRAWVAVLIASVFVLGTLGYQQYQDSTQSHRLQIQQKELSAECSFFHDIGTVPLPNVPKPSKLAVSLVSHSIGAYTGLGCGSAVKIDPRLSYWEHYYHIKR